MEFGLPLAIGLAVFFGLAIGGLAIAVKILEKRKGESPELPEPAEGGALPYRKREWLLDHPSEKDFYAVLEKACAQVMGPCRVMVQVQLSRLIEVPPGTEKPQVWRNKIDRKSVDYVVCDAGTLRPRFAVELDGSSHDSAKRLERDRFVERALEAAGVKLVRVERRRNDSLEMVAEAVTKTVGKEVTA